MLLRPSCINQRNGLRGGIPRDEMHQDLDTRVPFYRPEPAKVFPHYQKQETEIDSDWNR